MNAQQVAERSAVYALEDVIAPVAGEAFDLLATAPQGVAKLRELFLDLAVHGQLLPQNPTDEPAAALLRRIHRRSNRREAVFDVSDVPAGWIRTTFQEIANDLCTGPFGTLIGKSDYIVGGVPLINPSHLSDGCIVADERVSVSLSKARALSAYALAVGDIVFARRGDVGRNAVVSDDQDGWLCGTGSFFARFDSELCRPFLHIVFDSPSMRRYLCGSAVGSTMVNLNQKVLMRAPVRLPPLAEQRRIVARVEELMGLCDELETHGRLQDEQHARLVATVFGALVASASPAELANNWQRVARHFDLLLDRPEAVDALEQTILQLAVRGLLVPQDPSDEPAARILEAVRGARATFGASGASKRYAAVHGAPCFHVPAGWEAVGLLDLCTVGGGATPSKNNCAYWGGNVPWVSPKDMKVDEIRDSQDHVTEQALRETRLPLVPKRSLLVVVRGMILAHSFPVAVTTCEVTLNQDMKSLAPDVDGLSAFLALVLKGFTPEILDLVGHSTHGTCKLESERLFGFAFGLPPLAEQHRIVARVDELRGLCANLRQHLQKARTTQSNLADALVARAAA